MQNSVSSLVPHKGRMLLLDGVKCHSPASTVCFVRITPQSFFFQKGGVPAWVAIEYMAQAVAAHAGLTGRERNEKPRIGFLVGARRIDVSVDSFALGETVEVEVKHTWGDGDTFSFQCEVRLERETHPVATAELIVHRPDPGKEGDL